MRSYYKTCHHSHISLKQNAGQASSQWYIYLKQYLDQQKLKWIFYVIWNGFLKSVWCIGVKNERS